MASDRCRLCGGEVSPVIDLGVHPLADRFLITADEAVPTAPLVVALCAGCGYAGLTEIIPPEDRYQAADYSYTAGNSSVSRHHFRELATEAVQRVGLRRGDLVIDIGGNDGTLLQAFSTLAGCNMLNIEPAPNIARLSRELAIPTVQRLWGPDSEEAVGRGRAALIVATNTFNHASDPAGFVAAVAAALKPGGWFVFEVPSLRQLVRRRAFDTIYLEHVSYFGLRPLLQLLGDHGLGVEFATEIDYMGGSFRIYARAGGIMHDSAVLDMVDVEDAEGIYGTSAYLRFTSAIGRFRVSLRARLAEVRDRDGITVGIGAAAKGNTLLNYCGIDRSLVAAIADTSPLKVGKFAPGSLLPIIDEYMIRPGTTHALILPWNLAGHLRPKLERQGLEVIVPNMEQA